jgi:hypothetical protein
MVKILLISGAKEAKIDKMISDLIQSCAKRNMTVQVVTANLYSDDLQAVETTEKPDIIVSIGTNKIPSQKHIINGLALMYPWMGLEKLVDEIASQYQIAKR